MAQARPVEELTVSGMRWVVGALGALTLVTCSVAQQMTANRIIFKDPGPFRQEDLESVAGVHAGQTVVLKDLQAAAQRLADTGCFEDVRMDSTGTPKALTIIFLLRPTVSGALYPVRFENLVWATDEELQAVVHQSMPLFHESLPETTSVLDTVGAGLKSFLASKGVSNVEVVHDVVPASSADPKTVVTFHVSQPSVRIRAVAVQGAAAPFASELERTATKLKGAPYVRGDAPGSTAALLLKPYKDAGYLQARLTNVKETLNAVGTDQVATDLSGNVESGPLFHFGTVSFAGTPVFSEQAFAAESKVRAGETASQSVVAAAEAPVEAAYHKLGYMYAYVDPHEQQDAAAHTVSYALQPVSGETYKLRTMQVQGLTPDAKALFQSAWKMQPGDPYNADYVAAFLHDNSALRGLEGYAGTFQASADPSTHTVDLTVLFARTTGR